METLEFSPLILVHKAFCYRILANLAMVILVDMVHKVYYHQVTAGLVLASAEMNLYFESADLLVGIESAEPRRRVWSSLVKGSTRQGRELNAPVKTAVAITKELLRVTKEFIYGTIITFLRDLFPFIIIVIVLSFDIVIFVIVFLCHVFAREIQLFAFAYYVVYVAC
jgi:hypothetical protein